jgi:DMSO/TMAO reductase YedYZ molybdopterin-dependent catalytic subunit
MDRYDARLSLRVLLFLAATMMAGPSSVEADKRKNGAPATLIVGNEAAKLVTVAAEDWNKLPRRKLEMNDSEGKTVRYEGVSLADVLRFAGVPFNGHLRGRRAANYVLIEARDRYRVVLALAEIDPSMTDLLILLADRQDSKPLPESVGPYRLIVPGDKIHSRWVRQVTRITIRHPGEGRDSQTPKK